MSGSSIQITDQAAFKKGSLGKQVLFAILTLGLYGVYWWYNTHQQFDQGTSGDFSPTMQTVLYIIPLANLYAIWKFSNTADDLLDQSGAVLFVLFLVFPPAFWYLVQSQVNDLAGA